MNSRPDNAGEAPLPGRLAGTSLAAFTLVELLVTIAIVALLAVGGVATYRTVVNAADKARSIQNLRQLVTANVAYEAENGTLCPAQDRRNRKRWHGGRSTGSGAFDPTAGFLSPFLGDAQSLTVCPGFKRRLKGGSSFEINSGGYGYNAAYVGGTPGRPYTPTNLSAIPNPNRTVMFTTTALAKSDGVQEYPFCEPYVSANGGTPLQPSVHFRFSGKALVAWCDGHVTEEKPSRFSDTNFYGGDNAAAQVGWFGPEEENGYWNPFSPAASGE